MTNPNNAIGTNGAFSGRTSPNALNDITGAFTKGITSGWVCSPKTGMTVQLGGSASVRDVALAEDNAGNKLTINNRSGAPVEVTLDGAPSTNNRIDAIVAYVDNPSTGDDNTTDNPTACGIISVKGTVAANPSAPTDAQIRSAITTDGATGGVAYYVVLATILVGTNVTTIGSGVITQGAASQSLAAIADGSITTDQLAANAATYAKIDWDTMPSVSGSTLITGTVTSTSWTQVGSTFTPTKNGLYFFEVKGSVYFGSSEGSLGVRLYNTRTASDVRVYEVYSWNNWAGNYSADLAYSTMLYLTTSDTIRVDARTQHTAKATSPNVWITRIY